MPGMIEGGCLCGAIRYAFPIAAAGDGSGPTLRGNHCHCSMCRKATGGGFASLVRVQRDAITWSGVPATHRSSPLATRGFCRTCGSPLYYDKDGTTVRWLTAGSLDDPSRFEPTFHYGVESRLPWADCGQALPARETQERFDGQPP